MTEKMLTIIPAMPIASDGDSVSVDRKFFDGMRKCQEIWSGPLHCVARRVAASGPVPDSYRFRGRDLPFGLTLIPATALINCGHLRGSAVVLAAGDDFSQLHVSELCRRERIGCVYVIENIPETRRRIVDIDTPNRLIRWRRQLFLLNAERRRLAAFRKAQGLQANGTPAFEHYRWHPGRLLYFDTRVESDAMISDDALAQRLAAMSSSPLRLAFSGRLTGIKGADQLIPLAALLRQRRLDFRMTIYGTGDLAAGMAERIGQLQLGSQVRLAGALDFATQLIPEIQANTDLYVMLHRQSDPSCTYLETLACGIPIAGYANKAWSGLLGRVDAGWSAPVDDLTGMADLIVAVAGNRPLIAVKSRQALAFARAHDFEHGIRARISQLRQIAG